MTINFNCTILIKGFYSVCLVSCSECFKGVKGETKESWKKKKTMFTEAGIMPKCKRNARFFFVGGGGGGGMGWLNWN